MYRQKRRSSAEERFPPPPPLAVGKKGVWERRGTHQTLESGWMVDGRRRWGAISFISPSSSSPPPRHPRLLPFRERGECICVYGKCWGCLLLKASRVEPLALSALLPTPPSPPPHRCLPPPFSWDKECPECPASPAVSNN